MVRWGWRAPPPVQRRRVGRTCCSLVPTADHRPCPCAPALQSSPGSRRRCWPASAAPSCSSSPATLVRWRLRRPALPRQPLCSSCAGDGSAQRSSPTPTTTCSQCCAARTATCCRCGCCPSSPSSRCGSCRLANVLACPAARPLPGSVCSSIASAGTAALRHPDALALACNHPPSTGLRVLLLHYPEGGCRGAQGRRCPDVSAVCALQH